MSYINKEIDFSNLMSFGLEKIAMLPQTDKTLLMMIIVSTIPRIVTQANKDN